MATIAMTNSEYQLEQDISPRPPSRFWMMAEGRAFFELGAFYMMSNSLEVSQDGTSVNTVRRWLGIPISRKSMARSRFARACR